MFALDPFRLDRVIAELAQRFQRFTTALVSSDAEEHAFEFLPNGIDLELLEELKHKQEQDPIARPAYRWLGFLLTEQALLDDTRGVARALFREPHGMHRPEPGEFSIAAMRERSLAEPAQREAWMAALAEHASTLTARRRELFERRADVRERLGVASLVEAADAERVPKLALAVLAATDDAYAELEVRTWQRLLDVAIGTNVPGEWPARSSGRALADLVREGGFFDGLKPEGFDVPRMHGASSVLRGMYQLGAAVHEAAAPPRAPFVITREPTGLRRSATSALFARIPTSAAFAERRLGISRGRTREYTRQIATVALVAARQSALRALLGAETRGGRTLTAPRFIEFFERALGFEPRPELALAVFTGDRDGTLLCGLLLAARRERLLVEMHDEDWFRNPRAVRDLRAELEVPPASRAEPAELDEGVHALARSLVEAL